MEDLSHWIAQPDAARRLGLSEKQIVRWAEHGRLHRKFRPRAGKKPEPVYHPDDVARHEAQRNQPFMAEQPSQQLVRSFPVPSPVEPALPAPLTTALAHFFEQFRPAPQPRVWITLQEASARSGLSRALLQRAIKAGALRAIHDRAVKVLPADVDNLDAWEYASRKGKSNAARATD